ncbi:MFS transporter [Conexibacter arvalis]|uniref:Putative MFS family arabinose efflux permease n=1 Tax=Conexibacter arvalis TaxID=912552 RepID=A0A840IIN0_9ACTN|nr:MFS transporter [Conexibacter arvalis]MBB4664937.1 putative MFS family arabinose efflux permease [Conexibacter arvalis]
MALRRPRVATGAMFLVSGAVIGVWAANVPYVRDRLDISTTTIGFCLLAMAAGSLLAMPLTGRELQRRPSAQLTRLGAVLVPLAGIAPLLAPSVGTLAAALFVLGIAVGILDVSMNAHGIAVERFAARPVMSSLHASWSVGGLAAAGAVALGHLLGADPRATAAVVLALLLATGLAAGPHLGELSVASGEPGDAEAGPRFVRPSRGALLIGGMVFALFMAEGAVTDWSALYLDRDLEAGATVAALGYGAFAGGMALARALGDRVNRAVGARRLLRAGSTLAALSLAAMVALGLPALALPLLLLAGFGVGNGVPLLFSAAGRIRDMPPGPAIAAASTMGYLGLLAGPPLLGFVADATSLPLALGITALLTGGVALLAGRTAEG